MNEQILKLAEALDDSFSIGNTWQSDEGIEFGSVEILKIAEVIESYLKNNGLEISDPFAAEKAEKEYMNALEKEFSKKG